MPPRDLLTMLWMFRPAWAIAVEIWPSMLGTLALAIGQSLTLRGFIVSRHEDLRADFMRDMSAWVSSGQVKYRETRYEGLAQAPQAFIGLFSGANTGKMIVHLAD